MEMLQKFVAFCFNYQRVDCLYTLFKYRLSGKINVKNGKLFDIVQRAVHSTTEIEEWTNDQHREKETLEEKV